MPDTFDPYHIWLGIPRKDQPPNHYRLLGIERGESDPDVIEHAADRQMTHLRSVQTGKRASLSQQLLNEVATARACLLNPQKKASYDAWLDEQAFRESGPRDDVSLHRPTTRATPTGATAGRSQAAARPGARTMAAMVAAKKVKQQALGKQVVIGLLSLIVTAIVGTAAWLMIAAPSPSPSESEPLAQNEEEEREEPVDVRTSDPPPPPPQLARATDPSDSTPPDEARPTVDINTPGEDPNETNPRDPTINSGALSTVGQPDVAESPTHTAADGPSAADPDGAEPPVAEKIAVPALAVQDEIVAELDELYHFDQFASAPQKSQIATALYELGEEIDDEPAERFVALRKAMEFAREAGNIPLMLQAVELIGRDFDIDVLQVKVKMLGEVGRQVSGAGPITVFVQESRELIDEALAEDRYEIALQLAEMSKQLAQQPGAVRLVKEISASHQRVQKLYERYQETQRARTVLQGDPEDPAAHLILARWHCFTNQQWDDEALQHLAKCSDQGLAAVARQELAERPATAAEQVDLADAWWQLATEHQGEDQIALVHRARFWYQRAEQAAPTKLLRLKIERQLDAIADLEAVIGPPPGADDGPASPSGPLEPVIVKAWQLARGGNSADARTLLSGLDPQYPNGIRIDFTLGLICALYDHEWPSAEKYFGKCTKRQPDHVPSWNNVALTHLRLGDHVEAVRSWRTALQLADAAPEVLDNLRRLDYLNQRGRINLSDATIKSLTVLCATEVPADAAEAGQKAPSAWRYMPFSADLDPAGSRTGRSDYDDRWCVVCNGRGEVDCPKSTCARGTVRGYRHDRVAVNPLTGDPIIRIKKIRVPCGTCGGRGMVDCRYCSSGKN